MHPDIEKLINIAKEGGELTDKQKEIILRKAEKLGEDTDEVEMILETMLPPQREIKHEDKKTRCPNCGAIVSETTFACPECGYILQQENKASIHAREMINDLQSKLMECEQPTSRLEFLNSSARINRQVLVINTFTMPTTKEGLVQFLEFAYSNYISFGMNYRERPLKHAWYGKTMQAYNSLARLGDNDPGIKALLSKYSSLISKEKRMEIMGLFKL